jgi:hypothetical protein
MTLRCAAPPNYCFSVSTLWATDCAQTRDVPARRCRCGEGRSSDLANGGHRRCRAIRPQPDRPQTGPQQGMAARHRQPRRQRRTHPPPLNQHRPSVIQPIDNAGVVPPGGDMTIKGRQVGHRSSWSRTSAPANWCAATRSPICCRTTAVRARGIAFDAARDRQTADEKRSYPASEESSLATVLMVTPNTAPACPGQHRHFGEVVKGLKGRRKTNGGNGIRLPATTAGGRATRPYFRRNEAC